MCGDLNRIAQKALEKSPVQRYGSPSELAGDIERHVKGEPVLAGPSRQTGRVRRSTKPPSKITGSIKISTIVLSDLANDTGDPALDGLVRQSISFELERSANLKVLPAGRVLETLSEMRRTAQTRVTPEIAREIGQRTASAAFIESSLSNAGPGYLLTIRVRNCTDGSLVDQEQSRAAGKEGVLKQIRRLTIRLQSKSAASLTALQGSAARLDAATTSSVEALKSFSAGRQRYYENPAGGLLLFRRAIELDPEFALAYAWLGRSYADSGEQTLAMENIRQAYSLRGAVSDKENFFITYNYNRDVLRNFELCRQVCDSWIDKYPQELTPHGFLSGLISAGTAQYEKAIKEGEKAIAMNPDFTIGYHNLALAYLSLNLTEEVKASMQRAAQRKLPTKDPFGTLFFAAFLNKDRSAMDKAGAQLASDIPSGDFEYYNSLVAAYEGRLQQSRQASIQAITLSRQAHLAQRAALFEGAAAVTEALYGYPDESSRHSFATGQLAGGRDVDFGPAFALALCGNSSSALAIVTRLEEQYPEDTCVHFSYSPALRALLAIMDGSPAKAIELLTVSKAYELAQTGVSCYVRYGAMYPTYVRGLAYQQLHKPREAAAEFQRMLDHPGLLLADPVGPAARLQLARSLHDSGETTRAKAVYSEFLTLWKEADPDIPLLKQAKIEFARL